MEKLSESKLYEYSKNDTGITIVSYLGFECYVEIPDSIEGNTVTEIGNKAFVNCKEETGISIPVTVSVIADRFAMPLKLFIKRSKPRICKDSLIIYTNDCMDYDVLSGKVGEIRNLFSTFGDKYVKVKIECS
jgi:hypothetical protein